MAMDDRQEEEEETYMDEYNIIIQEYTMNGFGEVGYHQVMWES